MKNKFKVLMAYLRNFKKDEIEFSWIWNDGDGDPEWHWGHKPVPIINSLYDIVIEITSSYLDELFDLTQNCYSDTGRYDIVLKFYPKKNKAIFSLYHEDYKQNVPHQEFTTQLNENGEYVRILKNLFDTKGIEFCKVEYSGNYDDGDINNINCDGKELSRTTGGATFTARTMASTINQDWRIIENVLYDVLENAFSGWELDYGSDGTIEINNNLEVHIEHNWTEYEFYKCENELEITEDTLT